MQTDEAGYFSPVVEIHEMKYNVKSRDNLKKYDLD